MRPCSAAAALHERLQRRRAHEAQEAADLRARGRVGVQAVVTELPAAQRLQAQLSAYDRTAAQVTPYLSDALSSPYLALIQAPI